MPDQLKPCPFCKESQLMLKFSKRYGGKWMYVLCEECGTKGPPGEDGANAVELWNDRPGEAAERERCIRAVEEEDEGGCSLGFAMGKKAAKVNIIARIKEEKQ